MARARRFPDPAPEPSNVVELRPGFAFPAAEVTSKKRIPRRRKPLLTGVTTAPYFLNEVTKETSKNTSKFNNLLMSPGLIQVKVPKDLSPSGKNAAPSAKDPTFQRQVARLAAMELRTVYRLEATAHRNMRGRSKGGTYTVAPEFRDFRRFLTHVGPCPAEGWTLDRKDPRNPVYGPGLVRWADKRQQANNRATTVHLTMDGVTRPLAEWARVVSQAVV